MRTKAMGVVLAVVAVLAAGSIERPDLADDGVQTPTLKVARETCVDPPDHLRVYIECVTPSDYAHLLS